MCDHSCVFHWYIHQHLVRGEIINNMHIMAHYYYNKTICLKFTCLATISGPACSAVTCVWSCTSSTIITGWAVTYS